MSEIHRAAFQSAMRSYNAMETTKRRHFDFLTLLETKKKKFNLDATLQESEMLRRLLRDHDEEVRAFKARCEVLRAENEEAHTAFFRISRRNKQNNGADCRAQRPLADYLQAFKDLSFLNVG